MTLTVRDFRPSDARAVADLRRAALPFPIATPQGVAWRVGGAPPAQWPRSPVAERDRRVIGQIDAGLLHESSARTGRGHPRRPPGPPRPCGGPVRYARELRGPDR
ncbi:hypothetical protein [Streptomyces sp. NPDC093707]|uniref:hypothetical protein n=1 Tax=Streptomyces sp. NPDC093707 TaxID=3154984 RepID=UPI00344DC372